MGGWYFPAAMAVAVVGTVAGAVGGTAEVAEAWTEAVATPVETGLTGVGMDGLELGSVGTFSALHLVSAAFLEASTGFPGAPAVVSTADVEV